jgi:hypothetical protein
MAQTYSQGITGIDANACYNTPATIQVGDKDLAGDAVGISAAAQAGEMASNDYILCMQPDGSQAYYRIDAERSIPGVSLVMIKV